ncbi:hypothetical protein FA95DRAFT_1557808, partial [Auriscalpium vulgare]
MAWWHFWWLQDHMQGIQSLFIAVNDHDNRDLPDPELCALTILDILNDPTPVSTLRHLRYSSDFSPAPWRARLLTHLTSLDVAIHSPACYGFDKMLNSLEKISGLKRLSIKYELEEDYALQMAKRAQTRSVLLAKLARLEITAHPKDVIVLTSHLEMPQDVAIHCNVLDTRRPKKLETLFTTLLTSSHGLATLTGLEVTQDIIRMTRQDDYSTGREPAVSVHLLHAHVRQKRLYGLAALQAVVSVRLEEAAVGLGPMRGRTWGDWMRRAPAVRRLTVQDDETLSFCTGLRPANALPALAILVLAGVRLAPDDKAGGAEALLLCLSARAEMGLRLEELDVVRCSVDGIWLERARDALPGTRVTGDDGARENEGESRWLM